jgi:hypothetical protein
MTTISVLLKYTYLALAQLMSPYEVDPTNWKAEREEHRVRLASIKSKLQKKHRKKTTTMTVESSKAAAGEMNKTAAAAEGNEDQAHHPKPQIEHLVQAAKKLEQAGETDKSAAADKGDENQDQVHPKPQILELLQAADDLAQHQHDPSGNAAFLELQVWLAIQTKKMQKKMKKKMMSSLLWKMAMVMN